MNLLALPRYTRLGASSRLRIWQYVPALESAGIRVTLAPFFSDTYVTNLQRQERRLKDIATAYWRRISVLVRENSIDLIWIEKEALPWIPAWLEMVLLQSDIPYVLDYDDAVFLLYEDNPHYLLRKSLSNKHPALLRRAKLVTVGNDYLGEFAKRSGARHVELLPTVVELARYELASLKRPQRLGGQPVVGWIGQRSTAEFLRPYVNLFTQLSVELLVEFHAIGIDASALELPMLSVPWAEETEAKSIASLDIGIMPLTDTPFERGKCGYKLIQYMACGLPVVASPVGINCRIVEHGVNGFLAATHEQWESALRTLVANPDLRRSMGLSGRKKVEQQYCLEATREKLISLLTEAAK